MFPPNAPRAARCCAAIVPFMLAGHAGASVTITSANLFANANHDVAGVPAGGTSDVDSITPGPFPQTLNVAVTYDLPLTSGSYLDADLSGTANIRDDGVDGVSFFEFDYFRNTSGSMNATIRTTVIFTVTGSTGYELTGGFFATGPGNQLRITEEGSGALVAGTYVGDPVNEVGVLGAGTYRLTAQLNRGASGSGGSGDSLEFAVQYDLTFTDVPAPGSAVAMGLLGLGSMRRRRGS